jgi:hypothetical protein
MGSLSQYNCGGVSYLEGRSDEVSLDCDYPRDR